MSLSQKGTLILTSASSSIGGVRGSRSGFRGCDPRSLQQYKSSELSALHQADKPLVICPKSLDRILLINAGLALGELHLALLRSIPAIVESLASCSDLYLHEGRDYALVILVLRPKSKEAAEAAQFVRHRWSSARILLLETESSTIDDWLYDARIEPHVSPAAVREAAIRLMGGEKGWIPA